MCCAHANKKADINNEQPSPPIEENSLVPTYIFDKCPLYIPSFGDGEYHVIST